MSRYVTKSQLGGNGTAQNPISAKMFYTETQSSTTGDAIYFGRALQNESAQRQKSIGTLGANIQELKKSLSQKVDQASLETTLAEKDEQISTLKKSLENLEAKTASVDSTVAILQKSLAEIQETTSNLCVTLQNFKREMKVAWWFAPWGPGFDTAKDEYQKCMLALDDFYDVDKCMSSTVLDMIDEQPKTTKQMPDQDCSNHTPTHTPNVTRQENLESTFQSTNT